MAMVIPKLYSTQMFASSREGCQSSTLAILMIATNGYLTRWTITASSLQDSILNSRFKVRIILFTDEDEKAKLWGRNNLTTISLTVRKIPSYGWPEATLFRYRIFEKFQDEIIEDVVMYLDSDMKITSDFTFELAPEDWLNGLAFVHHPGFYQIQQHIQESSIKTMSSFMLKIRYSRFFRGGFGDWEGNRKSTAYTQKKRRKTYVHGAVWFGKRREFMKMVSQLNKNVTSDYEKNFIAKWHDESHLNWYFAHSGGSVLTPRYSGFVNYPEVMKLSPMILSEIKEKGEGRTPGMRNPI